MALFADRSYLVAIRPPKKWGAAYLCRRTSEDSSGLGEMEGGVDPPPKGFPNVYQTFRPLFQPKLD